MSVCTDVQLVAGLHTKNFKGCSSPKGEVTMPCKVTNRNPQRPSSVSWNAVDQTHINYLTNIGTSVGKKNMIQKQNPETEKNVHKLSR